MKLHKLITEALESRIFSDGCVRLHDGPRPESEPVIEGQIVPPTSTSIAHFRSLYAGLIETPETNNKGLRVLEIGAGMGNCTYGFLRSYEPSIYIASEPFETLVPTLRRNLDDWGYHYPHGIAASFDANFRSVIPKGTMNIVIGNSVLHHITKWRDCLDYSGDLLTHGGKLIFGEPNQEAWVLIVILVRSLVSAELLSPESQRKLEIFVRSLEHRFRIKDNEDALSKLEDKHIFSFVELLDYANSRRMTLSLSKRNANLSETLMTKLHGLMATSEDVARLHSFLQSSITPGIENTTLNHPFLVFSLSKSP